MQQEDSPCRHILKRFFDKTTAKFVATDILATCFFHLLIFIKFILFKTSAAACTAGGRFFQLNPLEKKLSYQLPEHCRLLGMHPMTGIFNHLQAV